jgi:uncharacterized membrane protein
LLTAPVFVFIGMVWRHQRFAMVFSALVLLALGTAGAFVATSTGEAAAQAAEQTAATKQVLDRHEDLAELASWLFLGITALAAAVCGLAWWQRNRPRATMAWGAGLLLLASHAAASIVLINAAHEGGRLVHEFGVHAGISTPPVNTAGGSEQNH